MFREARTAIVKLREEKGKNHVLEILNNLCGSDVELRDAALHTLIDNLENKLSFDDQVNFGETLLYLTTSFCSYAYVILYEELFSEKIHFDVADLKADLKMELEAEPIEKSSKANE